MDGLREAVDLDKSEWSSLHFNHCTPFVLYEYLRPCKQFEDGVFTGSIMSSMEGYQEILVHNLYNLFTYCQIVEDEAIKVKDNEYLDTKFFSRRAAAVKELKNIEKKGTVIGYCLNGTSFHRDDKDKVMKYFSEKIYYPLIQEKEDWLKLKDLVRKYQIKTENHLLLSILQILLGKL